MLRRTAIALTLLIPGLLAIGSTTNQEKPPCHWVLNPEDSLQLALDLAPENTVICLNAGLYGQGEEIKITNAWLTLRGAGAGKTVISGSFSVSWIVPNSPFLTRRGLPVTQEVRFTNLTIVPRDDSMNSNKTSAIWTIYHRSSDWRTGRIVLDGVELVGLPQINGPCSSSNTGITVGTGMELEVKDSVLRGFDRAIASSHYYPPGAENDEPRITILNSHLYNNCVAVVAERLEMENTKIEKNALGMILSGSALIKGSTIADQGGTGLSISGNSHVTIENSQILRNGRDMIARAVWRHTIEDLDWRQTLEGLDVINNSGITLAGASDPFTYEEIESKIVLSVRGSLIQENQGWGIAAYIWKCGDFNTNEYQKLEVQLELDGVNISNNNRNWLKDWLVELGQGDICLPQE